jgi:hypothetical protein
MFKIRLIISTLIVFSFSTFCREQIFFNKIYSQTNLGHYGHINEVVNNEKTFDSLCKKINVIIPNKPDFTKSYVVMIGYPQTRDSYNQKIWTMFNEDTIIRINLFFDTVSFSTNIIPAPGYKCEIGVFPIQPISKYIFISYISKQQDIGTISRKNIVPIINKLNTNYKFDALGRRYSNSTPKNKLINRCLYSF